MVVVVEVIGQVTHLLEEAVVLVVAVVAHLVVPHQAVLVQQVKEIMAVTLLRQAVVMLVLVVAVVAFFLRNGRAVLIPSVAVAVSLVASAVPR